MDGGVDGGGDGLFDLCDTALADLDCCQPYNRGTPDARSLPQQSARTASPLADLRFHPSALGPTITLVVSCVSFSYANQQPQLLIRQSTVDTSIFSRGQQLPREGRK